MKVNMQVGLSFSGKLVITQTIAESTGLLTKQASHFTSTNALDQKLIKITNKLVGENVKNVAAPANEVNSTLPDIGITSKYQRKVLISNFDSAPQERTIEICPDDTEKIGATSLKFII